MAMLSDMHTNQYAGGHADQQTRRQGTSLKWLKTGGQFHIPTNRWHTTLTNTTMTKGTAGWQSDRQTDRQTNGKWLACMNLTCDGNWPRVAVDLPHRSWNLSHHLWHVITHGAIQGWSFVYTVCNTQTHLNYIVLFDSNKEQARGTMLTKV